MLYEHTKTMSLEKKAHELALESDIVIVGSAPDSYMLERLRKGKLLFTVQRDTIKMMLIY